MFAVYAWISRHLPIGHRYMSVETQEETFKDFIIDVENLCAEKIDAKQSEPATKKLSF